MNKINQVNFFKTMEPLEGKLSLNNQEVKSAGFKDMFANMINEMNKTTNEPQITLENAMQGRADLHDVMTAIAKSELTVQAATTVTSKILQTYEKIMQIQI